MPAVPMPYMLGEFYVALPSATAQHFVRCSRTIMPAVRGTLGPTTVTGG